MFHLTPVKISANFAYQYSVPPYCMCIHWYKVYLLKYSIIYQCRHTCYCYPLKLKIGVYIHISNCQPKTKKPQLFIFSCQTNFTRKSDKPKNPFRDLSGTVQIIFHLDFMKTVLLFTEYCMIILETVRRFRNGVSSPNKSFLSGQYETLEPTKK